MAQVNSLRDRRKKVMLAAAARWEARMAARATDIAEVEAHGPGSADSPMRQARYSARQSLLQRAVQLREQQGLPVFVERKIGPTLDMLAAAPSEAGRKAGRPVARIVTSVDPRLEAQGFATGFMISPRLLLTNQHVFPSADSARGTGANFLHDVGDRGLQVGTTFALEPSTFFLANETLDFAIVAVSERAITGETLTDMGYIVPTEATAKVLKGQRVDIIQYPDGGPKEYATTNNRLLDILDAGFLHYETDTLEGSSGSPVYSENWELVALHHAGIPEVRGGQIITTSGEIWNEDMGDDAIHWVANEGIRISAIVQALGTIRSSDGTQASLLYQLLSNSTDPTDDICTLLAGNESVHEGMNSYVSNSYTASSPYSRTSKLDSPIMQRRQDMTATNLNFTGPVTVHVYAPDGGQLSEVNGVHGMNGRTVAAAVEKTLRFDPDYGRREGYDSAFLGNGIVVPVPAVVKEREEEMYQQDGEIVTLPYHHYSLTMNRTRRMQMWSAVNVDYAPDLRSLNGRQSFGTDRWIGDPRIPANIQLADADIYGPAGQIDRGHIVRREDSAWGETAQATEYANSDTFHWTNCTPQHQAFNRASPGKQYGTIDGLWGSFEAYVQKSLQHGDTKACILAGPVLSPDDPTEDFGNGPVQYPIQFWKVVAVAVTDPGGGTSLRAYGFVLSQKDVVTKFGIEFDPGQYARYQRSLKDISELTGVMFHDDLLAKDTMPVDQ
jgi:endonuclease G